MNPSSDSLCPTCGTLLNDIDGSSASGLCPRCLLAESMKPTDTGHAPGSPPSLSEVNAAFPELEVLELIGRGGMGAVYKARQTSLDRFVALKLLPKSLAADPAFAERFQAEAKALATLDHPNIVTVHDFGQQGDLYFLLMEFVDGLNLRELIRDGSLSAEEALAIVPPLCEALEFAHGKQIVHRDIKPENLLLDSQGRIKIADFGIAKMLDQTSPVAEQLAGTPAYMAPEQKLQPHTVDTRADIYSLGVVLYEMLTGQRPDSDLTPPSSLNATLDIRLDEVVLRALAKDPEQRWQSATALNTQLQTALEDPSPTAPERLPRSSARRAWLSAFLVITPLLLGLISIFLFRAMASSNHARALHTEAAAAIDWTEQIADLVAQRDTLLAQDDPDPAVLEEVEETLLKLKAKRDASRTATSRQRLSLGATVVVLAILAPVFLLCVIGFVLAWRHLSWLRGQAPARPGLPPALFAALFYPVIGLLMVLFLLSDALDMGKGGLFDLLLSGAFTVCLMAWITPRLLAWTRNLRVPRPHGRWWLAIPLLFLAFLLPYNHLNRQAIKQQRGESIDASSVLALETRVRAATQEKDQAREQLSALKQQVDEGIISTNRLAKAESRLSQAQNTLREYEMDRDQFLRVSSQRRTARPQWMMALLPGLFLLGLAMLLLWHTRPGPKLAKP